MCFRAALAAVVCLAAVASGCVTMAGMEPPELTLVDLAFVDATLFESTLEVTVRVTNGNPEPLTVDGLYLKLSLGGSSVGKGTSDVRVEVPRLGSETIPLTLHVSNLKVVARLRSLIEREAIDYGLDGRLYVATGSRTIRLPIEASGRLDLGESQPEPTASERLE